MKKGMLLGVVAALVTLALGTGANAQTTVKSRVNKVNCPGSEAACIKLDLYQAMAATSSGTGKAATARGAAASNARAAMHKSPLGGVENNPMSDGASSAARVQGAERQLHRGNPGAAESRAPSRINERLVTRHRPAD